MLSCNERYSDAGSFSKNRTLMCHAVEINSSMLQLLAISIENWDIRRESAVIKCGLAFNFWRVGIDKEDDCII